MSPLRFGGLARAALAAIATLISATGAAQAPGAATGYVSPEASVAPWAGADGSSEQPAIFGAYEISTPVGTLRAFTGSTSFRGFELGAMWPVYRALFLGPVFNHHFFHKALDSTTYPLDAGAVHASLYRYARLWSVAAAARYVFLSSGAVARPYLGLRMGIAFANVGTMVADLSLYDTPTGFALAPEAGVLLGVASVLHLSGAVRYDFSTVESGALQRASALAFQFALVFHGRN